MNQSLIIQLAKLAAQNFVKRAEGKAALPGPGMSSGSYKPSRTPSMAGSAKPAGRMLGPVTATHFGPQGRWNEHAPLSATQQATYRGGYKPFAITPPPNVMNQRPPNAMNQKPNTFFGSTAYDYFNAQRPTATGNMAKELDQTWPSSVTGYEQDPAKSQVPAWQRYMGNPKENNLINPLGVP